MDSLMLPPSELGTWRGLDESGRIDWLKHAAERFFARRASQEARALVTIDGEHFDDLLGFLCAMGEAVAGPGGYFGASLQSFDDCLFGGFGIETPCTIVWKHSARSREVLESKALARECAKSLEWIDAQPNPGRFAEGGADRVKTLELATQRRRTLFDEIVEMIESVAKRHISRPDWRIELRLE